MRGTSTLASRTGGVSGVAAVAVGCASKLCAHNSFEKIILKIYPFRDKFGFSPLT